jgi:outer membrane protein OmpA-like peptidoglycan-associated protein
MRSFTIIGATLLLVAISSPGLAQQQSGAFSVQNFQTAPGHGSFLTVEGATVPDGLALRVGGLVHYQYAPLMVRGCERVEAGRCAEYSDDETALVAHQLMLEAFAAVGFFHLFEAGLVVPVVLYQTGDDVEGPGGEVVVESPDNHVGLEDLRLHLKLDILHGLFDAGNEDLGLALLGVISFPVGNAINEDGYMGDSSVTVHPKLAFGIRLGRVRLGVNGGWIWREEKQTLLAEVGPRISYGTAAEIDIVESWSGIVEVFGQSAAEGDPSSSPLEAEAAARYRINDEIALTAGLGAGIIGGVGTPMIRVFAGAVWAPVLSTDRDGDRVLDDDDQCPDVPEDRDGFADRDGCPEEDNDKDGIPDAEDRCPDDAEDFDEFEDADGCPEEDNDNDGVPDADDKCPLTPEDEDGYDDQDGCPEGDNDGDGIPDDQDECPDEPEDKDEFEDADGCPDEDNDGDGIPDDKDQCRDDKEVFNGVDDEDGCPDEGDALVQVDEGTIRLLQKVHFKTNSDQIVGKNSFRTLDVVVGILKNRARVRVRIEGHTDSKGDRDHNLELSRRRAEAVKRYIVDRDVDADRLEAEGFGPDKPIADNKTKAGRAKNRRVEFHILER